MKMFVAAAAAAASLAGASAPALAQIAEMDMLTGKVFNALRDCDIDANAIDTLTMAQVSGIVITAGSADEADKCQRIEAIARGSE
ncbi:hypothetical protein E2L08_10640 [Palleronia sediminis]|uniref:Uncharacterized protein n=1 Tax=Palleronia sediminis TaxID=2547833 RepID=A0A4R6A414_9RHOB|nr:hypothetical protein [Palleronia sediminis]TDL78391.1 hypothetical protein E2L08_10640 [Palleronia sediminis]